MTAPSPGDTARPTHGPTQRGEVLPAWRDSLVRRGLAPSTVQQWVYQVRRWWTFVGDKRIWRATYRDVERYMDSGNGTAQYARTRVVVLHAFYVWARRTGLSKNDPTIEVERPKVSAGLPRPIPDGDLALALALAEPITKAALLLAATSGLRCIELARLRWDDVDELSLRVHGKGDRWRVVPIHPDARDALMELGRRHDGRVFPGITIHTNPANVGQYMSSRLNRYLHGLGLSATAHQLRHWFATKALAQSHDLRAVQELLGHAGPNTTAIYARLDPARLAPIVRALEVPGMPDRAAAPAAPPPATRRAAHRHAVIARPSSRSPR
jgi:integrase